MLNVLYEDNHLIIVEKPQNVPSQEDETGDLDMLAIVKRYIKEKYNKPGNVYVGLVHRLDRPTGGLMVFAKTSKSAERISKQIRDKIFKKYYLAVVEGEPIKENSILINYLKKDNKNNIVKVVSQDEAGAKDAKLEYNTLCKNKDNISLLKVELFTGRSHQIRVQLSNIGNPIIGDMKYGSRIKNFKNLSLWAYKIKFMHPTTNKVMEFKLLPPVESEPWNSFDFKTVNL